MSLRQKKQHLIYVFWLREIRIKVVVSVVIVIPFCGSPLHREMYFLLFLFSNRIKGNSWRISQYRNRNRSRNKNVKNSFINKSFDFIFEFYSFRMNKSGESRVWGSADSSVCLGGAGLSLQQRPRWLFMFNT